MTAFHNTFVAALLDAGQTIETDNIATPEQAGQIGIVGSVSPAAVHQVGHTENGSILASLRSPSGVPKTSANALPSDLVSFGGMTTTVANAERMGLLIRHPASGMLMDAGVTPAQVIGQDQQAQPPAAKQQPEAEPVERMDRKAEAIMTALVQDVPQTLSYRAVAEVTEQGTLSQGTLNAIASSLGLTPEETRGHLDHLASSIEQQRTSTLARAGIDAEDLDLFYSWVATTRPDAGKKAHAAHLANGDLSGYRKLAAAFHAHLDEIDPDRILEADFGSGITAKVVGHRVVLSIPGHGEMTYGQAYRMGLIRVRRG